MDAEVSGETDHIAAACLLVRRRALEQAGLFDESFYYWFEDTDLCFRLKEAGWKNFYLAEARVNHYGSTSLKRIVHPQRKSMYYRSYCCFLNEQSGALKYHALRLALALGFLFRTPFVGLYKGLRSGASFRAGVDSARASIAVAMALLSGP